MITTDIQRFGEIIIPSVVLFDGVFRLVNPVCLRRAMKGEWYLHSANLAKKATITTGDSVVVVTPGEKMKQVRLWESACE